MLMALLAGHAWRCSCGADPSVGLTEAPVPPPGGEPQGQAETTRGAAAAVVVPTGGAPARAFTSRRWLQATALPSLSAKEQAHEKEKLEHLIEEETKRVGKIGPPEPWLQVWGKDVDGDGRPDHRPATVYCAHKSGLYNNSLVSWDRMSRLQRDAARYCGYDELIWDGPNQCMRCFKDLADAQKEAAMTFGSDGACWDRSMTLAGLDCGITPETAPNKGCDPYTGVFNPDSVAGWDEISEEQRKAVSKCGWNRVIWDGPRDCAKCWHDLNPRQRYSMGTIGTDAACWDESLNVTFGLDCVFLVTNKTVEERRRSYKRIAGKSRLPGIELTRVFTTPSRLGRFAVFACLGLTTGLLVAVFLRSRRRAVETGDGSGEELVTPMVIYHDGL